ncbi:hypothetical protein LTR84_011073 [Exophiala bonariae]|uniref:20S-pre-rRNA D-site endonuclease NOB1 n=1 Tax=Exophiala bonariae TaxID=1690606 RepID=A0AAV9NIM5_9EURO|nr:hypothetical protein LTR84_011073 [Exophiala bonariae]
MAEFSTTEQTAVDKPVHTIILDSSPLLLNTPGISTLLANAHDLVTTPSVISEIRGEEARSRIDTLYRPFLTIRNPKSETVKLVRNFARKTGDGAVLSSTDYEVLALAYDIECERNRGNWRLRSAPGQKSLNGSPPSKEAQTHLLPQREEANSIQAEGEPSIPISTEEGISPPTQEACDSLPNAEIEDVNKIEQKIAEVDLEDHTKSQDSEAVENATTDTEAELPQPQISTGNEPEEVLDASQEHEDESDSESGWITPANIKKKKAKDEAASSKTGKENKHLQVATMTGDFAMQNVLLQMNLNLLSTKTCQRISQIKQFILRCHGCFSTTKEMSKQFCPRCGQPTLTRVSCSTNDKGEVKLHLKANMQWNNKGNVFSVPKAAAGTSNQKWKGPKQGGGQGGWGNDLILAEDQKEYIRAMSTMKRSKERDLMDEDTLPSILSGNRDHGSGRIRVGAGRNVNSKKR